MQPEALEQVRRLLSHLEDNRDRLAIDADTHATRIASLKGLKRERYHSTHDYFHGRPLSAGDLIREMDMAEVDMALAWQNPAATDYTDDPEQNYASLFEANRYVHESACRYPERFIPGGWTDPKALGLKGALKLAGTLVEEFGFALVKMNPAQNGYPIDSEPVMAVVDRIVELGAVPCFHFGADTPFTPASGLERVAGRHPEVPLLSIHMGGGGAGYLEGEETYLEARELGLRQPNIRYVFSAKRDTHIETDLVRYQLAGEPFKRHLMCGSDAPYGRMTWNFGGFRAMLRSLQDGLTHTDERVRANPELFTGRDVRGYLGVNCAEFTLEAYERMLAVEGVRLPPVEPCH